MGLRITPVDLDCFWPKRYFLGYGEDSTVYRYPDESHVLKLYHDFDSPEKREALRRYVEMTNSAARLGLLPVGETVLPCFGNVLSHISFQVVPIESWEIPDSGETPSALSLFIPGPSLQQFSPWETSRFQSSLVDLRAGDVLFKRDAEEEITELEKLYYCGVLADVLDNPLLEATIKGTEFVAAVLGLPRVPVLGPVNVKVRLETLEDIRLVATDLCANIISYLGN